MSDIERLPHRTNDGWLLEGAAVFGVETIAVSVAGTVAVDQSVEISPADYLILFEQAI